ncbi:virulence factor MviN [Xylanimonas oleitrophica]|uniref:Virulence factor MviN n=1 Tax=Xylanimonas oleitrophica TaxID=2607479 RepID=A0A2W5WXN2_9MICO|nr:lipid II flippase MurJ [Xylanimonas oleitrophica]PZR52545.1 virulence factor MviN [Xylanimonas oleitrophica]
MTSEPVRSRPSRWQTLAGAALLITAVTLASRLVGFGRWLAQAQFLGTGGVDAPFNSANLLPNVLFEVAAGGALAGAVVPLLAGPLSRAAGSGADAHEARAAASRSASALLSWALVVLLPLGVLTAALARPIVSSLGLGDPVLDDAATFFLRVFAVQIPVYGVAVVLGGILQAHKRFFWQAFAPLVSSVVVIGVYAVFGVLAQGQQQQVAALPPRALEWLAWGTTLGVGFLALPLLVPVRRTGLRLRPTLRFPAGEGRRAAALAFAGVGALVAQQLSALVVMKAANAAGGPGAFTVYLYVQQVYLLPYAVLAFPIATSAFPHFAEHAAAGRREELGALVSRTSRSLLLAVGAGVAALLAAAPFVQLVFDLVARGGGAAGMAAGLTWMAPGLVGYALILHLSRALYVVDAGRPAVVATAAGWLVVAAGAASVPAVAPVLAGGDDPSWALVLTLLGASTTVGMAVAGAGLLVAVRRRVGAAALRGVPLTLAVVAAGAAAGAVLARVLLAPAVATHPGAGGARDFDPGELFGSVALGALAGVLAAAVVCLVALVDPVLRGRLTAAVRALRARARR